MYYSNYGTMGQYPTKNSTDCDKKKEQTEKQVGSSHDSETTYFFNQDAFPAEAEEFSKDEVLELLTNPSGQEQGSCVQGGTILKLASQVLGSDCLVVKGLVGKIQEALKSPPANLLNTISGLLSTPNALMSLYPETFSANTRLMAAGGTGAFLWIASLLTAAFMQNKYGEGAHQLISSLCNKGGIFASNFNFSFDTISRIVGMALTGDYANDTLTDAVVGMGMAVCLSYAVYMTYQSTQKASDRYCNFAYEIAKGLSSTFTMASFVGSIERLVRFFQDEQDQSKNKSEYVAFILGAQISFGVLHTILRCLKKSDGLNGFTKPLGTLANVLNNIGLLMTTIKEKDYISTALFSGGLYLAGLGAFANWYKPGSMDLFKSST